MTIIISLLFILLIEKLYSPRLDFIKESSLLILFYGGKNTRKRLIFKI